MSQRKFITSLTVSRGLITGIQTDFILPSDVPSLPYLTQNQPINLSGDATGSGTTAIPVTLADTGVFAGIYTNPTVQVDSKGRITDIANGNQITRYDISYLALGQGALALGNILTFATLPQQTWITAIIMRCTTNFAGGSINAYSVTVWEDDNNAGNQSYIFCNSQDVFSLSTSIFLTINAVTGAPGAVTCPIGADSTLKIQAGANGDIPANATQGGLSLWVLTSLLP